MAQGGDDPPPILAKHDLQGEAQKCDQAEKKQGYNQMGHDFFPYIVPGD